MNASRFAIGLILQILVQAAITYLAAYLAVRRALGHQRPLSSDHP